MAVYVIKSARGEYYFAGYINDFIEYRPQFSSCQRHAWRLLKSEAHSLVGTRGFTGCRIVRLVRGGGEK